jgi:hypothetical protein
MRSHHRWACGHYHSAHDYGNQGLDIGQIDPGVSPFTMQVERLASVRVDSGKLCHASAAQAGSPVGPGHGSSSGTSHIRLHLPEAE